MGKNLVENSTFTPEKLIADASFPLQTAIIKVAAGAGTLLRGTVLGKTSANKYIQVGGSTQATAEYILAEDIETGSNAEAAEVTAVVYVSGAFTRTALLVAGSNGVTPHEADLKKNGIYLKSSY